MNNITNKPHRVNKLGPPLTIFLKLNLRNLAVSILPHHLDHDLVGLSILNKRHLTVIPMNKPLSC